MSVPVGKVCIIVLNWNRPQDTIECLESLISFVRKGLASIIICDNGSTDDSEARIREWAEEYFCIQAVEADDLGCAHYKGDPSDLIFIQTGGNRGYAGGNNVGIHYALCQRQFEFVWILNNDTVVDKNALTALLRCARQHPQVRVFGSTVLDYTCRQHVQSAGGYRYFPVFTIIKPVYGGNILYEVMQRSDEVVLDCVNGAALFARTCLFRELGLLNEAYFLYYEELDLAKRMEKKGYNARWCKNSLVYHKGAITTGGGTRLNRRGSWTANYHESLSTLIYTAEHHLVLLPLVMVFRFLAKSIVYILRRQLYLFPALFKAYKDFSKGATQQFVTQRSRVIFLAYLRSSSV
jgi:GT2 family glycosyltransferase